MAREFKMPYGKFKGETLEEIYIQDVGYLEWLLDEYKKRTSPPRVGGVCIQERIETCFKEMRSVKIY